MGYNKIRGRIKEKYGTQNEFARALGISSVSLSSKLNGHTEFKRIEIENASILLELKNTEITEIFFAVATKKT